MSHQPSAPFACLVAPVWASLPGEAVPCACNRHPSASRIEPLASQIQSFCAKRLDDSRPLDSARAQRRLRRPRIIQSNRLIVFWSQCPAFRRAGDPYAFHHSPARYQLAALVDRCRRRPVA
jgi:hypothetical protein